MACHTNLTFWIFSPIIVVSWSINDRSKHYWGATPKKPFPVVKSTLGKAQLGKEKWDQNGDIGLISPEFPMLEVL